jgi:SNF2 family DNA or RNA helicase
LLYSFKETLYNAAVLAAGETVTQEGCKALAAILTLRKICIHPRLLLEEKEETGHWDTVKTQLRALATPSATGPLQSHSTKFSILASVLQSLSRKNGRLSERLVIMTYFQMVIRHL